MKFLVCGFFCLICWPVPIYSLNWALWNPEHIYPLCAQFHDYDGYWVDQKNASNSLRQQIEINRHFFMNDGGEALEFSQIWLPKACSYHRFTNVTFFRMIDSLLKNHSHLFPKQMVHLAFIGDSATRAIFCGITRILSGSELYGPCDNVVCGGATYGYPIYYKQFNQIYEVQFSPTFKMTFSYVYGLDEAHKDANRVVHDVFANESNPPYAVVLNSGAWDFDQLARSSAGHDPEKAGCDSAEAVTISHERASSKVISTFQHFSDLSRLHHSQLIYRTNHYNGRFGALCADRLLEERMKQKISNSNWKIWDNRGMSKDCWHEQNWDGFHFDRFMVYNASHHRAHMGYFQSRGRPLPGQLEIQLAQSLLNGIFYDYLAAEYKRIYGNRPPSSPPLVAGEEGEEVNRSRNILRTKGRKMFGGENGRARDE